MGNGKCKRENNQKWNKEFTFVKYNIYWLIKSSSTKTKFDKIRLLINITTLDVFESKSCTFASCQIVRDWYKYAILNNEIGSKLIHGP